jgi:hypothetical protein
MITFEKLRDLVQFQDLEEIQLESSRKYKSELDRLQADLDALKEEALMEKEFMEGRCEDWEYGYKEKILSGRDDPYEDDYNSEQEGGIIQ